ncbi:putative vegetative incompatibility protein HET-E-1 [Rhizoctonia solani 123E]|uniref:Putative vegetative incompatibility protein HET-E-1 n=1 Tax=Rhizoctonia solani 123E TaxID=1423351 RepID=A0A074RW31_9AGAM|nr:putative vegetative incompatibility protein HET-E-1 [Rhizoctonia solani 123E]
MRAGLKATAETPVPGANISTIKTPTVPVESTAFLAEIKPVKIKSRIGRTTTATTIKIKNDDDVGNNTFAFGRTRGPPISPRAQCVTSSVNSNESSRSSGTLSFPVKFLKTKSGAALFGNKQKRLFGRQSTPPIFFIAGPEGEAPEVAIQSTVRRRLDGSASVNSRVSQLALVFTRVAAQHILYLTVPISRPQFRYDAILPHPLIISTLVSCAYRIYRIYGTQLPYMHVLPSLMPFRQGVKHALKKAEENLKHGGDNIKALIKETVSSRPSTPSVSHLQVSEHANVDLVDNNDLSGPSPAKRLVSEQVPQEHGGASNRDLKQLATEAVGQVADTLKIGPLKDVSDMLQGFADMYKMEGAVKSEYDALQHRLQALLKVLESHSEPSTSPMVASKVAGIREFIKGELDLIERKPSGKQHGRFLMAQQEEERFVGCCRRIQEHMDRLALDANISTWRLQDENEKDRMASWIRLLPSSPSAWYNSSAGRDLNRRECTPGTRVDVLATLLAWANSNSKDAVYWLNGMAGTGKTTIAYSVCTDLAVKHKLAASFFCSRLREECNDVNRIIPSIAYQLAQFSAPFRSALSAVMEKNQDAHHRICSEQFETLIRRPLLAMLSARPLGPDMMVVVIDALDECKNKESTRDILDILLVKSADLPVKFVVSSRPEPQIRDQMNGDRIKSKLVLHELDTGSVHADIETYVREELKPMKPPPTESQIQTLVEKAGILFIYAATAVRYVGYDNFQSDPEDRLRTILAGPESQEDGENREIDQLYTTVLEAALGDQQRRKVERDRMQQVLNTVVCARDPLTVAGLSELLEIHNADRVRAVLRPLWSVLHVVGANELVTTLHASFPDFMFDSARSKTYYCDRQANNGILAEHCLGRIKRMQPDFNICGLESSYLPDDMVPNIEERVADSIPSDLVYSCRYWGDHFEAGECASTLAAQLWEFMSKRLLLWMEVLNLTKHMRTGLECMKLMAEWCSRLDSDEKLVELSNDARRFVEMFTSNHVSQSTPHIYISMLTFWPRSGPIAKYYAQFTHGPIQAEGTALDQRQLAYLATWTFTGDIDFMAMSPDGRYIALGTWLDLLLVDSSSGQVVLGPLRGHWNHISAIMFSPDQPRVFTGSYDYLINPAKIVGWDTRTGKTVVGPLELSGHTSRITCLTFSPDCTRIGSGSEDQTVRLWDAESGKMLHCLEAHGSALVITFSPNGTLIAAGLDEALHIWSSLTGDTTLGPLSTPQVGMLAFSPDSSFIIHTQWGETTLHVRDAHNGQLIHELDTGNRISRIGYSPDGRHIVTGHYRTINVWDAQNGNMKLGPLEGHTHRISKIAFSPDGSRIFSACGGRLVCTWDARQHNLAPSSISTPNSGISSAKFAPDGQHFVSGSEDGSLHIWDSHTGAMTVDPIKAHTSEVIGVDFLNDGVVSGSRDGMISMCDAQSGEVLRSFTIAPGHRILSIAFSPDGKLIATGSLLDSSSEINLWDAQTGTRLLGPLTDLGGLISSVQFSRDGTRIAASSGNADTWIVVWDVSDGRSLFSLPDGHTKYVNSISFSPNGALLASGSFDCTIIIWDAYIGSMVLGPLDGHSDKVKSVNFSPDSTRLVSGSNDDTIRIWDVYTGEMVFQLPHAHEQGIISVAYSPDGTSILSISDDTSLRIQDARSTKERALVLSTTEFGDWVMNRDGWVFDDQSRLLVWVPGDLRRALMWARTQVAIAPYGYVRVEFDKSRMGESWAESYMF